MNSVITVSILGCGWLGFPLAKSLVGKGYQVSGSTTTQEKMIELKKEEISPYLLKIDGSDKKNALSGPSAFFNCDLLIIDIPPKVKSTSEHSHPNQIKQIIECIVRQRVKKVIYISATSVYPATSNAVDESTPIDVENTGNGALFLAEQLLKETNVDLSILRCGGLLGYDRIPGKYYIGKVVTNGNTPVNYIHRDDAIAVIHELIKADTWNHTFNLVAPLHPTRKEVFVKNAEDLHFEPPRFETQQDPEPYKLVLGEKLVEQLHYEFIYPDPLFFSYSKNVL